MKFNIRAKLLVLGLVPLAVLILLLGSFLFLDSAARSADAVTTRSDEALRAYEGLLVTLIDAETGTRGYELTRLPRFAEPYRAAAVRLEPELARVQRLGVAATAPKTRLDRLTALARAAFAIETERVLALDREGRKAAVDPLSLDAGKRAMDRFRAAVATLEVSAMDRRSAGARELALTWHRTSVLLEYGVFIAFAITLVLYGTISRNIFGRLRQVGADALAIADGIRPRAITRGDDEITVLERSFRTMLELARKREASLNRYKLVSDHARDIMFWTDAQGRVIEANGAALQAYGYTRDEMLALRSTALCPPGSFRTFPEKLASVEAHGPVLFEIDAVRKNGEQFPVEMAINSTRIEGDPINFVVVRDITERRQASAALTASYESAVESSRVKSQFVSSMSHELRTPMNAVIGMNELLLGTTLTAEQREYTETVRDASLRLLGIIDDVLDFSRIEAERLSLKIAEMDVLDVVESAVAFLGPEAHRKGLSLMSFVHPEVRRCVLGDAMRLHQIIVNLAGNAVKFTKKGGVVVSVTAGKESATSSEVQFAVSDSGEGFDAGTAALIFQPFRQADGSTTRRFGGTGLGLTITQRLVELMGGKLLVTSTIGVGTEFRFSANFVRAIGERSPSLASLAGFRILIVDEDPSSRRIMSRYAQAWGMEAAVAAGVPEALAILRTSAAAMAPYHVAIVDHALGALTGFDLAAQIKADPSIAATHLIMLASDDGTAWGEAALAAGYSDYLTKPVRQLALHGSIATSVGVTPALPREDREAPKRGGPPIGATNRPERILLVEDQPVNRRLAMQQLKRLGFTAQAVVNGEEAVNAASRERYDVILMDCHMPVMDGFAATRAIRTNEIYAGHRVPIVAMTANARREDRDECLATGMDDYLPKPVQIEDLRGMLESWLPAGIAV